MERHIAPSLLLCAALALGPTAATGEEPGPGAVLLAAAAEPEMTAAEEAEKKKEEEKEKKEEARKAAEEKKQAEKEAKKGKEKDQEEPAAAAATSTEPPVQPFQKTFTISPGAAPPSGAAAPMKMAPGAVAPKALSPPVSRSPGAGTVFTAPIAPTSPLGKGGLTQPGVSGFVTAPPGGGVAPTSGPSSGISMPGAMGGAQEAIVPPLEGPKLPPGTLQLLVNGQFGETSVFPNQPVTASWDVSPALNTGGIALFVSNTPGQSCAAKADGNDLFPPSSYHPGFPKGSVAVDLGGQSLGSDLFFIGCAAEADSSGKIKYRKQDTNVVRARFAGAPDLIVSTLEMVSDEIRFKVKNVGDFEKKPGEVDYVVGLTFNSASGKPFTRGFSGVAGITSLARLAPGQETGEDRVTEQKDMKFSGVTKFQLCINPHRKIVETDTSNNCIERSSAGVLPDLAVTSGQIFLVKPYSDPCECSGWKPWTYNSCLGGCFDPSGPYGGDQVKFTVENRGGIALVNFEVGVEVKENGQTVFSKQELIQGNIAPGASKEVAVQWGGRAKEDGSRYKTPGAFSGSAVVDPMGKILEDNETNNSINITVD